ncbi:ATP synthase F1 subunit epsilon [Candidatus Saccharibacteria bacterium]|jgi:ATP synthase F1, epsilon subunit|nr:ATP synthase F1 subunit epsilon [Candidatus Saccharibacteria bacterium]
MNFQLVTLAGVRVDESVYEVIIPTVDGEISVFPSHEPLVTVAKSGVIAVRRDKQHDNDQMDYFAISGGVVEISADRVRVLVDEAEHGEDIVEAESQAALERAIKLRDEAKTQVELEKAHQLVDRHAVRLKVADLHRRRRPRA